MLGVPRLGGSPSLHLLIPQIIVYPQVTPSDRYLHRHFQPRLFPPPSRGSGAGCAWLRGRN